VLPSPQRWLGMRQLPVWQSVQRLAIAFMRTGRKESGHHPGAPAPGNSLSQSIAVDEIRWAVGRSQ
jgi:hypothetical protein